MCVRAGVCVCAGETTGRRREKCSVSMAAFPTQHRNTVGADDTRVGGEGDLKPKCSLMEVYVFN